MSDQSSTKASVSFRRDGGDDRASARADVLGPARRDASPSRVPTTMRFGPRTSASQRDASCAGPSPRWTPAVRSRASSRPPPRRSARPSPRSSTTSTNAGQDPGGGRGVVGAPEKKPSRDPSLVFARALVPRKRSSRRSRVRREDRFKIEDRNLSGRTFEPGVYASRESRIANRFVFEKDAVAVPVGGGRRGSFRDRPVRLPPHAPHRRARHHAPTLGSARRARVLRGGRVAAFVVDARQAGEGEVAFDARRLVGEAPPEDPETAGSRDDRRDGSDFEVREHELRMRFPGRHRAAAHVGPGRGRPVRALGASLAAFGKSPRGV